MDYLEERERIYKEFIEKLKEWRLVRSRTLLGLLYLIDYIDSFHKGSNVANIVGSGAGVVGTGAVLLAPFTGGLSLAVGFGGIAASVLGAAANFVASLRDNSVARENFQKAQDLIERDGKATKELITLVTKHHELTQKVSRCVKDVHTKVNFKSDPQILANSQVASKCLLIGSASAIGKGATKTTAKAIPVATAKAIPVISSVCIAIDVWSIVTTAADMVEGSKSAAGKELYKVVKQLQKQENEVGEIIREVIRIQSQITDSLNEAHKEEEAIKKKNKKKHKTKISGYERLEQSFKEKARIESDDSESDDDDEKRIKFCLMNARSVFNKWGGISCYVLEKGIDVLAVTETWDRKKPWVTVVPGYRKFFYYPREDRRGGGVGALVKVEIAVKDQPVSYNTFECMKCTLTVKFKNKSQDKIHAYILYRPPGSQFSNFLKEFEDLIARSALERNFIIMGDFNISWENLIHPKSFGKMFFTSNKFSRMQSMLRDYGLHQHVNYKTHEDNGILDWVITRQTGRSLIKNLDVDLQIKRSIKLDHYPIIFTVTLRPGLKITNDHE
ncbi:uncharacterized protein [Palaemon carinicauda]|uniref:uncharacterized protein n=1 Tax=Palaemon carinicauda TaxID=392227 RepID=UPI0035B5F0CF